MKKSSRISIVASWILLFPVLAIGSAELDRRFALETVGYLRAWDNVDGLFADYVGDAYREFFDQSSRFRLHDLSKADEVIGRSKIEYKNIIEDKEVLERLARTMRVETLIRTKVYKEGKQYRFVMDWLHSPKMERLSTNTFYFKEPGEGKLISDEILKSEIKKALLVMIDRLPIRGHVTGRDRDWITVNIGRNKGLRQGDVLVISTLEEVKMHPLLDAAVDWRMVETGRLQVDEVDDKIAFCRIAEQQNGRIISRFQKISSILPAPKPRTSTLAQEAEEKNSVMDMPKLGWFSAGLGMGSFSREYSTGSPASNPITREGGGGNLGFETEGQLWLTKNFFAEMGIGYSFYGYSQEDVASGIVQAEYADLGSGNITQFRFNVGYAYLIDGSFFGPKGFVRMGFRSTTYSLPLNPSLDLGSLSVSGLFVGLGGDLPIRRQFGAQLSFDIGVIKSETVEGTTTADPTGTTDLSFYLGGYYRWKPRITFRAGIDFMAHSVDFSGGTGLTHRAVTFSPSVLYYF